MPSLLGKKIMDYYELDVRERGFTKYNEKLDPSTIQSVTVAALPNGTLADHFSVQNILESRVICV